MKTLDGHELIEGEDCYVSVQCPEGIHNLSSKPRKAVYLSDAAKSNGWDFTICRLKTDCECEVIAVWKYEPRGK